MIHIMNYNNTDSRFRITEPELLEYLFKNDHIPIYYFNDKFYLNDDKPLGILFLNRGEIKIKFLTGYLGYLDPPNGFEPTIFLYLNKNEFMNIRFESAFSQISIKFGLLVSTNEDREYLSKIKNLSNNPYKYDNLLVKKYKSDLENFFLFLLRDLSIENKLPLENKKESSNTNINNNQVARKDYISWEEYFMGIAELSAKRSKDPKTQVGACIVKDNKILSIGYNGFPNGCSDEELPWNDKNEEFLNIKDAYVVHAELNAILNYNGNFSSLKGSTIYVTLFPCNECAKAIIQSGIKEVVYKNYKVCDKSTASERMFNMSGVKYRCINND